MTPFTLKPGRIPLLISMPHVGTLLPPDISRRMTEAGRMLPDTDWNVDRLYEFWSDLGVSRITPVFSRYVVDLNRPSDGTPLYPGAAETAMVPVENFDGEPLYTAGDVPDAEEIKSRAAAYWAPYHRALDTELQRLRSRHGFAVLWEAHSIRSHVPQLFKGRLPDLNLGTNDGASCDPGLTLRIRDIFERQTDYSWVVNGRFKGGYITRRYGQPSKGIHAVQMEISQITYMNEATPFDFDEARAARLRPLLKEIMEAVIAWRP